MRLLLDTHALLWWAFDGSRLSRRAEALVRNRDNDIVVSAASVWEISTKYRLGRLANAKPLVDDMSGWFAREGFQELPMSVAHAHRAGALVGSHGDPFDRMIAAQSLIEDLPVLGKDRALEDFGVELIW